MDISFSDKVENLRKEIANLKVQLKLKHEELKGLANHQHRQERRELPIEQAKVIMQNLGLQCNDINNSPLVACIITFIKRKKSYNLSFEELYQLFRNPETSFAQIAGQLNISRERVRQIYRDYFKEFFPNLDCGFARIKSVTKSKLDAKLSRSQFIKRIIPILESWNLSYEFLDRSSRRIIINDYKCLFKQAANLSKTHPKSVTPTTRVNIGINDTTAYDFIIVYYDVPEQTNKIFIIPAQIILGKYSFSRRGYATIYLPLKEFPYGQWHYASMPRVRWKEYEDAWHLLANTNKEQLRNAK